MKFFVSYYDIEQDKVVESECYSFSSGREDFEFFPIRGKIFKTIVISCPKVEVGWSGGFFNMSVVGYQKIKSGGYQKKKDRFLFKRRIKLKQLTITQERQGYLYRNVRLNKL